MSEKIGKEEFRETVDQAFKNMAHDIKEEIPRFTDGVNKILKAIMERLRPEVYATCDEMNELADKLDGAQKITDAAGMAGSAVSAGATAVTMGAVATAAVPVIPVIALGVATVGSVVTKQSLRSQEEQALRHVQEKVDTLIKIFNDVEAFGKPLKEIYDGVKAIIDKHTQKLDDLARPTGNKLDYNMIQKIEAQVYQLFYNAVKVQSLPGMEALGLKIVSTVFGVTTAYGYSVAKAAASKSTKFIGALALVSISADLYSFSQSFYSFYGGSRNDVAHALRQKAKELRCRFDIQVMMQDEKGEQQNSGK